MQNQKEVAIVGSGLVGSLLAIFLRKQGHKVTIFDRRPDVRLVEFSGRSINLAMSNRGWKALREAGIDYLSIEPMKHIHWLSKHADKSGDTKDLKNYLYNNFDEIINNAYDQRDFNDNITGTVKIEELMSRKKECLFQIKNNEVNTLKEIGELCLPEFEKANYFDSMYDKE